MEVHCVGVVSESSRGGFCGSSGTGLCGMFESNVWQGTCLWQ